MIGRNAPAKTPGGAPTVARIAALAAVAGIITACGPDDPTATVLQATVDSVGIEVTSSDFDDWPFIPDDGTLVCDPSGADDGRLLVRIDFGDGIEYALNGQARDFGFPELDTTVMPDWPDGSSLGPIIARGLELCA